MEKLGVTVGICAYNENNNIGFLLQSLLDQCLQKVSIDEIIVISDGSTDSTNDIVNDFCRRDGRIKLVELKCRGGKARAINQLLKIVKSKYIVLGCADILPRSETIERLSLPLLDENIGITTGRPVPLDAKDMLLGKVVNLTWELHHHISLSQPKFCDLIAFKNIVDGIPLTSSDEEWIASLIISKNLKSKYVPEAIFYMKGSENVLDFLSQRRRNFASHLFLKKKTGYRVATLSGKRVSKVLLGKLAYKNLWAISLAILLEIIGRFLGMIDFILKKEYAIWRSIHSTKCLLRNTQLSGAYWDRVARDCGTNSYPLEENIARYKKDEHLRLLKRWDIDIKGKTILKTDLFEEALGRDGFLFELSNADNTIIGMDISYEIVRRSGLRNAAKKDSDKMIVSDIKTAAFKENSFDLVISNSTLDHIPRQDVSLALGEIRRILKPNGILVLTLDNKQNFLYLLGYRIQQIFRINKFYLAGCYSSKEAIRLVEANNFVVQDLTTIVNIPTPFNKIALSWKRISRKLGGDKIIQYFLNIFLKAKNKKIPIFSGWFIALKLTKT